MVGQCPRVRNRVGVRILAGKKSCTRKHVRKNPSKSFVLRRFGLIFVSYFKTVKEKLDLLRSFAYTLIIIPPRSLK